MRTTLLSTFIWLSLTATGWAELTLADTNAPAPQPLFDEVTLETTASLEKAVAQDEEWMRVENGILIQFIEAPSPLDPINPLADLDAGLGERNISTDTVTRHPMGLQLIKFEF